MLNVSSALLRQLQSNTSSSILLIQYTDAVLSETFRYTDAPFGVTVGGVEYAHANGQIVSISPPEVSRAVTRHVFEIVLAGSSDVYNITTGSLLDVKVAFLTEDTVSDALSVFRGTCVGTDTVHASDGFLTTAKFASPLSKIDDTSTVRLTDYAQRLINANDTSLRFISETRTLEWGL